MKNAFTKIYALGIIAALFAFVAPEKEEVTFEVDPQQSQVAWKGEKVTGQHDGTVQLKEGTLTIQGDKLSSGHFTIDMSTIENNDLSGEDKAKLEGHLKSDDFFGVESHPEAIFVITKAKQKKGNQYEISGNLTIKDKTDKVTFPATVKVQDEKVTADATINVDRTKFGIRYGSGSFFDNLGDKAIYDDFELKISLVANQAEVGK